MWNAWKGEALRLLERLTGGPSTTLELVVLVLAALVVMTAALRVATALLGTSMSDLGRALQVVLLGTLVTLAAFVAARVHLAPRVDNASLAAALGPAAAALAVLAGAAVISRAVHRGNYFINLAAVLLAVAAAAGTLLMGRAAFDTFGAGEKRSEKLRERKQDIERFIPYRPAPAPAATRDPAAAC